LRPFYICSTALPAGRYTERHTDDSRWMLMSLVGRPGQYLSCLQSAHIYRLIDWVPPARRPLARLAPQRSLLAPSPHAQAGSEKKSLACTPACWPASSYPSNQSESRAWSKHAGSQVISLQATNHVDTSRNHKVL
jgi:hypothetical protein